MRGAAAGRAYTHCGASMSESAVESEIKSSAGGEWFGEHRTSEVEKGVRDIRSSTGEEGVRQLKSSV